MKRLFAALLIGLFSVTLCWSQEAPKKPETPPPAPSTEPLATLDQILEKLIEGSGGKAALEKLTSRQVKGTFEIPSMGASGTFESYARPQQGLHGHRGARIWPDPAKLRRGRGLGRQSNGGNARPGRD